MYQLSKDLIKNLKTNNINYCHWKSNLLLNEALAGYDDLDLLVKKEDIAKFEATILTMGFKEGSNKNISFSSVKHFYGHDKETGNVLHLHVYYQMKTGPSWTKSFHLDFEHYFLENLMEHESGMPVPQKHIELPIFIFRIMLKYSKVNEFLLVSKEEERTFKEIEYLLDGLDHEALKRFLADYFPKVSYQDIMNYIDTIKNGGSLTKYLKGNGVKGKLKTYKYLSFCRDNYNNLQQLGYRILNKLFFKQKKKLHSSGLFIVVAGLDATGKTTITTELKKWLGKNFTVSNIHFGKPDSTLLTLPFNLLIKQMRKSGGNEEVKSSIQSDAEKPKSLLYVARQTILAYDRYALAKKYWDKVSQGEIVLCDRYKSEDYGVMDSKRLKPELYNGLAKRLATIENNLYDTMPKPDVLFYLTVPVEVAVIRNEERIKEGKESEEFIKIRHAQNRDLTYLATHNFPTDTNREYSEVIAEIKERIWKVL
jgi:thymidylate kinase